jgi:probable HAF family extracellular repeat protein
MDMFARPQQTVPQRDKRIRHSRHHGLAIVIISLGVGLLPRTVSVAAGAPAYGVEDLGVLPGDATSVAMGINLSGQVVGWSQGPTGTRAFVYTDGVGMVALPGPAGRPVTTARAINDAGQVVGIASTGGTDIGHAVRWTGGVPMDLGTLGTGTFSEARSINVAGATVGSSYTNGGGLLGIHAFVADAGGTMTDLTPGIDLARAEGINDAGQIAGYRNSRAVRWQDGTFTDLGVPTGFGFSYGFAINDSGQVAGHVTSSSGNVEQIFRYTDGVGMVILGGLGQHNTAFGINEAGDVVGSGRPTLASLWPRAFLFTDGGGMADLNALIDPASGWVLLGAGGINDAGQIAAWGTNNLTGARHALRLTPISADTTPPSVQFVSPLDGATVTGRVRVKIVTSDDVAVSQVTLLIDGVTKATTTSSALNYAWRTRKVALGPHTLTAVGTDSSGNQSTRAIVVTVQG